MSIDATRFLAATIHHDLGAWTRFCLNYQMELELPPNAFECSPYATIGSVLLSVNKEIKKEKKKSDKLSPVNHH